jgi:7-cyano-7-deazaguanine synthase
MKSAVLLWSGGLDSTSAMYFLIHSHKVERLLCVSFEYGNMHAQPEADARQKILETTWDDTSIKAQVNHLHITLPSNVFAGGKSALLSEERMPEGTYHIGPNATEVPFRNATLLSLATARAIVTSSEFVVIANHKTDADNFAYPDCTPEFIGAMQNAVYVGSFGRVRLVAPFQYMSKADVVMVGHHYHAPMGLTWSCYNAHTLLDDEFVHCGTCPTCIERHTAFQVAGIEDPTEYEDVSHFA